MGTVGAYQAAPAELQQSIAEFFPEAEWDNAAAIAMLESGWSAFAEYKTVTPSSPCGARLADRDGTVITAEWSIGWFQINVCSLPADWDSRYLFNTRHNVGTAHMKWDDAGQSWSPWYFSAQALGLIPS